MRKGGVGIVWRRAALAFLVAVALLRTAMAVAGGSNAPATATAATADYAEGGPELCLTCHDKPPMQAMLKTAHAVKGDARTPFASHACQTCHGPAAAHVEDPSKPPPMPFGPDVPAREQNAVCLQCHQGGQRIHWSGSTHQSHDVACTACHTLHTTEDPLFVKDIRPETFAKKSQASVCFGCHSEVRAETFRISAHPIKQGQIRCSDCHNVHGSTTDHLLVKQSLNDTCYQCHAEKRGPFLWEHQPVLESCDNCHVPHGSNHAPLLQARPPWLCQACHQSAFHPSGAYGGEGLPGKGAPSQYLISRSCLNCHTEVHGSNHPSGVRFMR